MILVDAFIRFTGVGLLLLLAIFTVGDLRSWHGAPYLFMACITVAAAFLGLTIDQHKLPEFLHVIVRILDIPHLVFVWLFALSLFQSSFAFRPIHLMIACVYCVPILIVRLHEFNLIMLKPLHFIYLSDFFSLLLMGHLVLTTLRGRADDLLEKRRRARLYFVLVIAFVALSAALVEAVLINSTYPPMQTIWIATIWPAIVWACYWLLGADNATFEFQTVSDRPSNLSSQDQELAMQLNALMGEEEYFKNPDLTIVSLARQLGVTQHRLRAFINQTLGHQNFSAFINACRITAVKKCFEDPDMEHLSILTIVMDCGFKSLSPFNRAFKHSEGVTPSEYRRDLRRDQI